jgi:Glycosyl hydrolases family 18
MGMNQHTLRTLTLTLFAAASIWACSAADAADPSQSALPARSNRRPVICYVETLFGGATAADLDFRPCTHVVEAFVVVDPSGAVRPVNGLPRRDIISAARSAGARVLVSVGGATVPGSTFSAIASDQTRLEGFANALADFVAQSGYDGVDLDWEFPSPVESRQHLSLVRAVRSALFSRAGVQPAQPRRRRGPGDTPAPTITVPVAAYWIPSYNLAALHDEVDYVILMGYDFRNPALGPWMNDAKLWPVNAVTPIEGSVRGAASEMIRSGLGYDKLVIALPLYSSAWEPWVDVRARAASAGPLHPLFLEKLLGDVWITDPEALEKKIAAAVFGSQINGGNAAGIGVWQLGHQGKFRDLSDAIVRAMAKP